MRSRSARGDGASARNDRSALARGRLARGHALHGLVDVLVERVSAVGGDDDVRGRDADAAGAREEGAPRLVRGAVRAGERADDALRGVDDDVEHEGEPRAVGGEDHVAVDGVPLEDPGPRPGVGDELRAVVREDGLARGDAGQDRLAPAGEAREEVRFDESLGEQQVRLEREAVQAQAPAGGEDAGVDERGLVGRVVQDDPLARDDLLAELLDELLAARRAVARAAASGGELLESRRADRRVERAGDLGVRIGGGGGEGRLEDAEEPGVGDVGLHPGAAVGNGDSHAWTDSLPAGLAKRRATKSTRSGPTISTVWLNVRT